MADVVLKDEALAAHKQKEFSDRMNLINQARAEWKKRFDIWPAEFAAKRDARGNHVEIKAEGLIFRYSYFRLKPGVENHHIELVRKRWWGLMGTDYSHDLRSLEDLGRELQHPRKALSL